MKMLSLLPCIFLILRGWGGWDGKSQIAVDVLVLEMFIEMKDILKKYGNLLGNLLTCKLT